MNKEKIRKVLIIVSIILIIFGIISCINISKELVEGSGIKNSTFIIDGSDFSGFAQMFVGIGTTVIGLMVVFYFIAIVVVIWLIYGISLFIIKIIDKSKMKEDNKKKVKKYLSIIITILVIIAFITFININTTEKTREEYKVIEDYILNNYNVELKTHSMRSIDRGDIGINPGKSYIFTMEDNKGIEYTVFVDTYDRNKSIDEILSNKSSIKEFNIEKK